MTSRTPSEEVQEKGDEEQTDAAPEPRTTATVGNDGGMENRLVTG
jgi:hypothetical protein